MSSKRKYDQENEEDHVIHDSNKKNLKRKVLELTESSKCAKKRKVNEKVCEIPSKHVNHWTGTDIPAINSAPRRLQNCQVNKKGINNRVYSGLYIFLLLSLLNTNLY